MLLTTITNAVVTSSQIILSNVIAELRVVSASAMKLAQKLMQPSLSKHHLDSLPLPDGWRWLGCAQLCPMAGNLPYGRSNAGSQRTTPRDFSRSTF